MNESQIFSTKISLLNKHFPDVAKEINKMLVDYIPVPDIKDYSQLRSIVESFLKVCGITNIDWQKSLNLIDSNIFEDLRACKVTEIRELLMAVVVKLYQPDKMLTMFWHTCACQTWFVASTFKHNLLCKEHAFTGPCKLCHLLCCLQRI